jgi:hypothetical protein
VFVCEKILKKKKCLNYKNIWISGTYHLSIFYYQIEPTELRHIVVDALIKQHKIQQTLDESSYSNRIVKKWRSFRNYFTKAISKIFDPSFYRDAKTGRTLKDLLLNNKNITKRLGFVIQFQNKNPLNRNIEENRRRSKRRKINRNDDVSDEYPVESVQSSSEGDNEENNVPERIQNGRQSTKESDLDSLFE